MTKPDIIVYSELDWRVRLIPDPAQWVIERKTSVKQSTWTGKSWCITRKALIRVWQDRTGRPAPDYLITLCETARAMAAQLKPMEKST